LFDQVTVTLMVNPLQVPMPVPAPLAVSEALQSIEISSSFERSGFQLVFGMAKASALQLALLPAGYFDPLRVRVTIVATVRGIPTVIMDGVVIRQDLQPSNQPGHSTLTITGDDLGTMMGLEKIRKAFPGTSEVERIQTILSKYSAYGIIPRVTPPPVLTVDNPAEHVEIQNATDWDYLKSLAAQCGYVFYLEPGPARGAVLAYFGPPMRDPVAQPALSVNSDQDSNVDALSFNCDGMQKQRPTLFTFDAVTRKKPLRIETPDSGVLRPALGRRPSPALRVTFPSDTAHLNPTELQKRAFGYVTEGAEPVTGTGSLDVARYGHVLSARRLVGVRGAGLTYDGHYMVESVTHSIKRGVYKQNFQLRRDGLVSQTSQVMP
jgi:hypothetical protein